MDDEDRRQRKRRSRLRVLRPWHELLALAADYRENTLVGDQDDYRDLSGYVSRFRKKVDAQMRSQVLSASKWIRISSFFGKLENACSLNRILKKIAVWCLQFRTERKTESFTLFTLTGSSMAADSKRPRLLRTYGDVVSYMLQVWERGGVIAEE